MKKTIATLTLLSALLFTSISYGQTFDVVYLRIIEKYNAGVDSYMQINFSDGNNERLELEKLGTKGDGAIKNGDTIAKEIKKLLELGYSLKSHTTGGTEIICTTMVFIKEKE